MIDKQTQSETDTAGNGQARNVAADMVSLEQVARRVRATCVQMSHDGKEGHLASALSCVDLLVVLYNRWLNVSTEKPKNPSRDRLFFSKGHACTALYAVLADCGFIPKEWLSTSAQTD